MVHDNNKGGEFGKYYVQELQEPPNMMDPDFRKIYEKFSKRILWIDGNVCPGAFQMNTAWYFAVPERDPIFAEHSHGYSELIGFYGSNPDDPYELGGVIEFTIGGEAHRLTRTSLMFVPSDIPHNPMRILEVNKPIFHFSVVMNPEYAEAKAVYK
ncbi:MAG: hypothetical protein LBH28_00015 [Oscillospiraceae bacterium]|jgi:hypothetical protein|nr:hypothetical protein [Oscillospiraceae bacterium]